jgi:hypothetical protein
MVRPPLPQARPRSQVTIEIGQRHPERFRVSNRIGQLFDGLTQLTAPLLKRPVSHVAPAHHEQVEGIQHDKRLLGAESLQQVERRVVSVEAADHWRRDMG